jgi:MSHA biogenesis protein MshO
MARRGLRGFTLIELVIVIIVLGILAAVAAPIAATSMSAYNLAQNDLVMLDRVRYATERLAREVREVKYDSIADTYDFTSLSTASPVFTKSDDITVTVTNAPPNVGLGYSTPALTPAPILTDQVSELLFTYFDQDGGTTGITTANVRSVEVSLTLTQGSQTYVERTRVQLRNR